MLTAGAATALVKEMTKANSIDLSKAVRTLNGHSSV